MTEVNPEGFAFVQLRRAVSLSHMHDARSAAYQLGRLYEARTLAAQGIALRIFDADEARRFLIRTDDSLTDYRLGDEHYSRLPSHPTAEELLEIWEVQDYERDVSLQFNRTLALRNYIDNLPTFESFYSLILFASDQEWESAKVGGRRGYGEFSRMPISEQPNSVLIDGAHRASCACADALILLGGSGSQLTAPWPGLVGDQIPVDFSGFGSWLRKFDHRYTETIESTFSSVRRKKRDVRVPSDFVLSRLFYGMLELWASTPGRRIQPNGATWFDQELDVRAALAKPEIGVLAYNLDFGLTWATLLWRLAPMDERTLTRYDEAVELTLEYLASAQ